MTRVKPQSGEGAICASVRKMSAKEASNCAVSVVSLYGEMLKISDARPSVVATGNSEDKVVPPFLVQSAS